MNGSIKNIPKEIRKYSEPNKNKNKLQKFMGLEAQAALGGIFTAVMLTLDKKNHLKART